MSTKAPTQTEYETGVVPRELAPRSVDPRTRIGHVHLKTADIDRVNAFYVGILGFDIVFRMPDALFLSAGGYHHHLGFNTWESKGGSPPPPGTTGLYHVAILYPTRAALGDERPFTAAVLTANITLHATVCALARQPHVRYLHDISRHESRAIRAVEWLTRGSLRHTRFFCPTSAVRDALLREYPGARAVVQPYALRDPAANLIHLVESAAV